MDLRPGYRELAPPPALAGVLACLWVRVAPPEGGPPARVLPDTCTDLIWQAGRGAFVAGPDTGPILSPSAPGAVFIGARFHPGAGGPAFGVPLSELRDLRIDVADLRPELSDELRAALPAPAAMRRVVATAARLATVGPPDPSVRQAARLLADPRVRVETLAGDLGLSERHLLRRCRAAVGYGPKTLQRVLRLGRFLAQVDSTAHPDLARFAMDAGYADQAHLTRECTRLTGLPPAALARSRRAVTPAM